MLQLKHDCLTLLDHGGLTARGYKDYLFNAIYRLAFECEVLTKFPSVLHTKALLSAARFLLFVLPSTAHPPTASRGEAKISSNAKID